MFDIEHWKTRSGVVKINVAMSELPNFTANPGTNLQDHHTGRSNCACRATTPSARSRMPISNIARRSVRSSTADPTTIDKGLAPEGVHVFSMFSQWVPHEWNEEPHREELEAYADRAIDGYTRWRPTSATR